MLNVVPMDESPHGASGWLEEWSADLSSSHYVPFVRQTYDGA
jgi:hypothetical protein